MSPWVKFQSFADVFEGRSTAGVSLYLTLLGPSEDAGEAVAEIGDSIVRSGDGFTAELLALFAENSWQTHLVAAAALLIGRPTDRQLNLLWDAVCRPSWVSPQLVATAWRLDPSFSVRAKALIDQRCTEDLESRSQPGLPKLLSALVRLLGPQEVLHWQSDIERIIRADVDGGGGIAVHWIGAMEQFCSSSSNEK